ncbi:MAG: hypothetical protein ABI706_02695 [Ilumatobacteraceae bacterium]
MHANLRVDGANCPFCLNDVIDHLELDAAKLIDTIGTSLHDVAMAANEIVMSPIDPIISVLHCSHEPAHQLQPSISLTKRLETVTDALTEVDRFPGERIIHTMMYADASSHLRSAFHDRTPAR